jgi:hypothetical protein
VGETSRRFGHIGEATILPGGWVNEDFR